VEDLCDLYLTEVSTGNVLKRDGTTKKASTLYGDRGRIARHIKPLIGRLKVAAVTSADIERVRNDVAAGKTSARVKTKVRGLARVRGGRGAANRVVRLLGGIFSFAVKRRMCADNPCRGVEQYREERKTRRLNAAEYKALGDALRKAEAEHAWPAATAVIRFLALTGWRSGEALTLHWEHLDLERRVANLPDTKSGRSERALSQAACDVLRALPFQRSGNVFRASRGEGSPSGAFKELFRRVTKGMRDVTPHTLRHSFVSVAADPPPHGPGFSDLTIAALIGHKMSSITSRYAHSVDKVMLGCADDVGNRIHAMMA
jgi:integrase